MKKFLTGLIVGALLVGGGIAYYQYKKKEEENRTFSERLEVMATDAIDAMGETAREWGEVLEGLVEEYDLTPERLKKEMAETGVIVREKAAGLTGQVMDAAADAQTTARIKARLAKDPQLSMWKISVDTENGKVRLSGEVDSLEQLSHAMALVMDLADVNQVSSDLEVRKD